MITEQTSKKQRCVRCDTSEDSNVRLDCDHTLCLVCLSYIVIKAESKLLAFPTSIDCTVCNKKTFLKPHCISQIKTTIQNVLVPQFHQTLAYSQTNSPFSNTLEKPIEQLPQTESPERCSYQKMTGITTMNQSIDISIPAKSIPSYCSSPKSWAKQCCKIHPLEEYMFSCRDCQNQFLCLKCFTDNHHENHNIRSIKKTLELCIEQAGFSKLEIAERAELFELACKKLINRKELLNKRLVNSKQKISEAFQEIVQKIRMKEDQILRECQEYFARLEDELQSKISFFKAKMEDIKFYSQRIGSSHAGDDPLQFIRDCFELQRELEHKDDSALQVLIQTHSNTETIFISDELILPLFREIQKINISDIEPRQSITRMGKDLRVDTVSSFRTRSYQKGFKTQKTDPGEDEAIKQSKMRFMNLQETKSNMSPDHISQLFSRQLSCKNLHKQREQFSITSNGFHQQSFATSKQELRDMKERKERKTTGANIPTMQKQKDKFPKGLLEKKLKKIISKAK